MMHANQTAALGQFGMDKPKLVPTSMSPIQELLERLSGELQSAHLHMNDLESKVYPIRSASPVGDGGERPIETASPMEEKLAEIISRMSMLSNRISTLTNELRI